MTNIKTVIANSTNWQDAVCKIVDFFTDKGRPFSSGEITKELRTHRPDFVFGHRELGNFIQDLHWSKSICFKDAANNPILAFQVPRITTGKGRTPAGVEVFVYSPTHATGLSHDFEVDVPVPQSGLQTSSVSIPQQGVATPKSTLSSNTKKFVATVQGDKRMRVPRQAFDVFSHVSGRAMQGGDDVFVVVNGNEVSIYFEDKPNATRYSLTQDKGAVKFPSPNGRTIFVPGTICDIKIYKDRLAIELS